ncbi:mucin-5AC-like [Rhinatrema bivittatum]|uniref:mucin-5AC-like n=1 Tax=Rhinatrema bivittatum TaxID=194408 RepID=UPI00112E88F7|nr:mucin-5AC-like [Rhinatrema bivittatum]
MTGHAICLLVLIVFSCFTFACTVITIILLATPLAKEHLPETTATIDSTTKIYDGDATLTTIPLTNTTTINTITTTTNATTSTSAFISTAVITSKDETATDTIPTVNATTASKTATASTSAGVPITANSIITTTRPTTTAGTTTDVTSTTNETMIDNTTINASATTDNTSAVTSIFADPSSTAISAASMTANTISAISISDVPFLTDFLSATASRATSASISAITATEATITTDSIINTTNSADTVAIATTMTADTTIGATTTTSTIMADSTYATTDANDNTTISISSAAPTDVNVSITNVYTSNTQELYSPFPFSGTESERRETTATNNSTTKIYDGDATLTIIPLTNTATNTITTTTNATTSIPAFNSTAVITSKDETATDTIPTANATTASKTATASTSAGVPITANSIIPTTRPTITAGTTTDVTSTTNETMIDYTTIIAAATKDNTSAVTSIFVDPSSTAINAASMTANTISAISISDVPSLTDILSATASRATTASFSAITATEATITTDSIINTTNSADTVAIATTMTADTTIGATTTTSTIMAASTYATTDGNDNTTISINSAAPTDVNVRITNVYNSNTQELYSPFPSSGAESERRDLLLLSPSTNNTYFLEITPAAWTYSVCVGVYTCNGLWLIYMLSTIFRRNEHGYVYFTPKIHNMRFYCLWILNNISMISCLLLWHYRHPIPALIFLALIPLTCCLMLMISYQNCFLHGAWLYLNHPTELWCIRILVHNGLAIYATWTSIATLLNLGLVLKYEGKVDDSVVSRACLCIVLFALLFWFSLETFIFEKYVRYTFTIYPTAIVALFGILFKNRQINEKPSVTNILIGVLLGVSAAAFVFRLILLFTCAKLRPLFVYKKLDASDGQMSSPDSPATDGNGCWTTSLTENDIQLDTICYSSSATI